MTKFGQCSSLVLNDIAKKDHKTKGKMKNDDKYSTLKIMLL